MLVDLDQVPLRAAHMTAAEILSSESQERMCAVVTPENEEKFRKICEKWDVNFAVIGEVTDGDHLVITHHSEVVVDAPASTIADDAPVYDRPYARPEWQDAVQKPATIQRPENLKQAYLDMVSSPALCSRAYITEQYDRYVRGNTVQAKNADAGVLRIDEETGRGVAISTDASGRYTYLDPATGTRLALAEAYRNVVVTGARPVAITNCLNYGSPENPDVMWQFRESVHALADGAVELGIPVSGGNVSFYNQTGSEAILPTPVVGVLGVLDDVAHSIKHRLGQVQEPEMLVLLGETAEEFGGSIWQQVSANELQGMPPAVDLANEMKLAEFFTDHTGITAAHDLSEGGLAQAIFEMVQESSRGVALDLCEVHNDEFTALFSESASRVVVGTTADYLDDVLARAKSLGIPAAVIGRTTESGIIAFADTSVSVNDLREAWSRTLPELFENAAGSNSVVE